MSNLSLTKAEKQLVREALVLLSNDGEHPQESAIQVIFNKINQAEYNQLAQRKKALTNASIRALDKVQGI